MPQPRYKSYFICTTPRSGSTLLCKLLAATGVTGNPDSHFHTPSIARWLESYGLSRIDFPSEFDALTAIFAAAQERGSNNTGMFGLRLQRGSFDFFIDQVDRLHPEGRCDSEGLQAIFGEIFFIYLTRPNKLDQAISRLKAEQTGLWHKAATGEDMERSSPHCEPSYDSRAIARHVAELTELETAWKLWFEREGIQPLQISYDALSNDPRGVLEHILDELNLDKSIAGNVDVPTAKLSDEINQAWAKRFRAEAAS